jgi:hypothetical protein
MHLSDEPKPAEIQAIAQAVHGRPDAVQIHTMLLRSMQQAIYTATNAGHFGLAFEAYTHFTSPIRRYPDLLVHRVIKALLGGRRYHLVASDKTRKPELRKGGKVAHRSAKPCRRRWSCGKPPAATAAPTSAAPTKLRAMWKPGSSAATCASTWARSSPERSVRWPASGSS